MKSVLFDSDVLLDVLAQRQPFFAASAQALDAVIQNQVIGYVSGHAITNIFYILRRQTNSQSARTALSQLLQHLSVASVTNEVIHQALQSPMSDFEDAVTDAAATLAGIEIIVTRNIRDFAAATVPVMRPEEFLLSLQS